MPDKQRSDQALLWLVIAVRILTGCQESRSSQPPIFPTLQSVAMAMIDAVAQNDHMAYQACFTFSETVEIPSDLTKDDARSWRQMEEYRLWLREELEKHGNRTEKAESYQGIRDVSVHGRRATLKIVTRLSPSSVAITDFEAVMTDYGWRFIAVRHP